MMELAKLNTQSFINADLTKATRKIAELHNGVKKNLYEIASTLLEIDKSECYKDDGFKNISDYAEKVFGYKKAMVYNMIRVADKYLKAGTAQTIFSKGETDFSLTQMQEVLSLPPADVKEMVNKGEINANMTTKEIREVVKAKKKENGEETEKPKTKKETAKEEKADNKETAKEEKADNKETAKGDNAKYVKDIDAFVKDIYNNSSNILETIDGLKTDIDAKKLQKGLKDIADLVKKIQVANGFIASASKKIN